MHLLPDEQCEKRHCLKKKHVIYGGLRFYVKLNLMKSFSAKAWIYLMIQKS